MCFFCKVTFKMLSVLLFVDFLKITFIPSFNLVYWAFGAILLDLGAGIIRSLVKGDFLVSTSLNKTVIKLAQYIGIMLMLFIFTNIFTYDQEATKRALSAFGPNVYNGLHSTLTYLNNLVLLIIIYTELLSVLENLIAVDSESGFSKNVLRPIHYVVSLAVINNPFKKTAERMKSIKNNTKPNNINL